MKGPGICTTLIGNGISGDCLDGEEAFTAGIKEPYGVEVDPELGILFVDRSNHRIKTIKMIKFMLLQEKVRMVIPVTKILQLMLNYLNRAE